MDLPRTDVHSIKPNLTFFIFIGIGLGATAACYIIGFIIPFFQFFSPHLGLGSASLWYLYRVKMNPGALKYFIHNHRIPNHLPGNVISNNKIIEVETQWDN